MDLGSILEDSSSKLRVMNLMVSHFRWSAARLLKYVLSITLQHYLGPKKVSSSDCSSPLEIPYSDISSINRSLEIRQQKVFQLLDALFLDSEHMDWHGFDNCLAREQNASPKPANVYISGHLITSPPSHPDKIFTSILYMSKFLTEQVMTMLTYLLI